jgi:hypothetical protein
LLGGQADFSRRIERLFQPGSVATELTSRAMPQARKFDTRTATPYRATAVEPGSVRRVVRLDGGNTDLRGHDSARRTS